MKRLIYLSFILGVSCLILSCGDSEEAGDLCRPEYAIEVVRVLDAVEGQSIGSISVKADGGNGSYSYSIDGMVFQSSGTFTDLPADTYLVTARDQAGCEVTTQVNVRLTLPVSFSDDIQPILQNNCMIPSCHCDGNPLCFDNYETVSANAEQIAKRTASRNMPPAYSGRVLTEDQITTISNWVNQGAADN